MTTATDTHFARLIEEIERDGFTMIDRHRGRGPEPLREWADGVLDKLRFTKRLLQPRFWERRGLERLVFIDSAGWEWVYHLSKGEREEQ